MGMGDIKTTEGIPLRDHFAGLALKAIMEVDLRLMAARWRQSNARCDYEPDDSYCAPTYEEIWTYADSRRDSCGLHAEAQAAWARAAYQMADTMLEERAHREPIASPRPQSSMQETL